MMIMVRFRNDRAPTISPFLFSGYTMQWPHSFSHSSFSISSRDDDDAAGCPFPLAAAHHLARPPTNGTAFHPTRR